MTFDDGLDQREPNPRPRILLLRAMQTLQSFNDSVGVSGLDTNAIVTD